MVDIHHLLQRCNRITMNGHHDELCSYYAVILGQLDGLSWHPSGNGSANCPYHDDGTKSLSVKFGRDRQLLLKCHSDKGCSFEDIVRSLGRPFELSLVGWRVGRRPVTRSRSKAVWRGVAGHNRPLSVRF